MKVPEAGYARMRWMTGKVSVWVQARDIQRDAHGDFLLARDDDSSTAAMLVPSFSVAAIEYITDKEHEAIKAEEEKKAKAKAREIP